MSFLRGKFRCTETLFANGKTIHPGKTLIFFDEIQDCPNAIMALRYFYEKCPDLHIIAAGSLLEFTLGEEDFRMPVGRVQSCYLKPLSFVEYLKRLIGNHWSNICNL